jgi:hypothetical protein
MPGQYAEAGRGEPVSAYCPAVRGTGSPGNCSGTLVSRECCRHMGCSASVRTPPGSRSSSTPIGSAARPPPASWLPPSCCPRRRVPPCSRSRPTGMLPTGFSSVATSLRRPAARSWRRLPGAAVPPDHVQPHLVPVVVFLVVVGGGRAAMTSLRAVCCSESSRPSGSPGCSASPSPSRCSVSHRGHCSRRCSSPRWATAAPSSRSRSSRRSWSCSPGVRSCASTRVRSSPSSSPHPVNVHIPTQRRAERIVGELVD